MNMKNVEYDFVKLYDEYCNENKAFIKNIIQRDVEKKIEEYRKCLNEIHHEGDLCDKLDKKVIRSGNEKLRSFVLNFYDFLLNKYDIDVVSSLKYEKLISDHLRRKLEVAKYLHNKPTRREISEEFSLSDRTLRNYLSDLKDGIDFLDTTIKLDIKDIEARNLECTTTMHPIFLSLNLTELWALTKYLPQMMEQKGIKNNILDSIINRIKMQLTGYAIETLDLSSEMTESLRFNWENETLFQDKDYLIGYMMKSHCLCNFIVDGELFEGYLLNEKTILVNGIEKNIGNIYDIEFFIKENILM